MYPLSHAATSSAPLNDTVYKFRLNGWAMVLLYQCVVMALPVLKLLHVSSLSDCSWLWITLPVWAPSALLAVVLGVEQVARLGKAQAGGQLHNLIIETTSINC